ncbi:hypothetical protein B4135_0439 [Caldibacillus debilis]|uniref:site-specific DNA-methyltransferase (adenine-specific) n=2 Tax=Caldibacillus debilis TaxID=301148 RepID=A0A150L8W4_9BACI|nr:hypothetical protein B4135_0439 [Caldibacillus debilis]
MRPVFDKLLREYKQKGYDQLIEEVAYTWFNRIIAIRYMELHDYLPNRIRVLSSETPGKVDPDILTEYQNVDLPINKDEITALLNSGKREEAYRKLFIAQCRQLHELMPFLFEQVDDYTELLLPEHLLHTESVIYKLVHDEGLTESFQEVEVIGWLYQFYISEKKDEVFADLKKNKKISKENIPAATQLFTPNWIVRYMVDNSLGQLWLERHPESKIREKMKYYIEPVEQEPEVKAQLEELIKQDIKLEEIKILDPACGSGHILVYAFDLLYEMYEEQGYPAREIPKLILENNLFGIDIDDRAAQLAGFALMMKARQVSRKVFRDIPTINIVSIQESNDLDEEGLIKLLCEDESKELQLKKLIDAFKDAKNYGALLKLDPIDFEYFEQKIKEIEKNGVNNLFEVPVVEQLGKVKALLKQAKLLIKRYHIVVTNPPYMWKKGMNPQLKQFLSDNYPMGKNDLFAAFMLNNIDMVVENGFFATINQQSWMFLKSYEDLRKQFLNFFTIFSMMHLGPHAFEDVSGEVVQSTCFVIRKKLISNYKGIYIRLVNYESSTNKKEAFLNRKESDLFIEIQTNFTSIPGTPIAYWVTDQVRNIFKECTLLREYAEPRQGLATSDNDRFLRLWHEVSLSKIGFGFKSRKEAQESKKKWFPYNKGGEYRKWYGNQEYIVNWENDGYEIRNLFDQNGKLRSRPQNTGYYFKEGITWSFVSSSHFGVRYSPPGFIFDVGGSSLFPKKDWIYYFTAFLCSKLSYKFLQYINPTLNFQVGNIGDLPIILDSNNKSRIEKLALENIEISKNEWDSFETSWDFKRHPFITFKGNSKTLAESYANWAEHTENQFRQMQANEEELNRIFIELYGLQDELTPEVPDEEVTVRRADRERDAKSFLSYFIGCVMGRYSLDVEGLVYAGGTWDESKYITFKPDKDGIIPLTDAVYFEDDIITRLQEFLAVTFGTETVQENMQWLAESLGMKQNETAMERLRRYFFDEFYLDHFTVYQKRPIYWMVDSGKQNGFRALIYLHRYSPEMLATLRFDYLQELQTKIDQEIKRLEQVLINPDLSKTEQRRLKKQIETLKLRQEEMIEFDKTLADVVNQRIELDLDDGVKINYNKLKPILAKVNL